MKRSYLGEFEEVVLLTVALLDKNAYGVAITEAVFEQTGREVSISAVHATLHRLQGKGFVKSHMAGATKERGGRRKRFFAVTPPGSRALHEIRQMREEFWQQIPGKALHWKSV